MNKEKEKVFKPSDYAVIKGVSPSRITHLKDKLIKKEFGGKWFVVDCFANDDLFKNPAPHRGKKIA